MFNFHRKNKDQEEIVFSMREYPYKWMFSIGFFVVLTFLPLILVDALKGCALNYTHRPEIYTNVNSSCYQPLTWELYYLLIVILFVVYVFISGRFVRPWSPSFIITESAIRYNRFPVFLSFKFLDTHFWQTYPLKSVATVQLLIREQDKDKTGFSVGKLPSEHEGFEKDLEDMSFEEYYHLRNSGNSLYESGVQSIYRNQYLVLFDHEVKVLSQLAVSFTYNEDLKKLDQFLQKKNIPFTVVYKVMPDQVKNELGSDY